jgi:hypothetical protein
MLVYHILQLHIFHNVNEIIPLMIWVSIYDVAHVRMNTLQPMICFEIPLQQLHRKVKFTYK